MSADAQERVAREPLPSGAGARRPALFPRSAGRSAPGACSVAPLTPRLAQLCWHLLAFVFYSFDWF